MNVTTTTPTLVRARAEVVRHQLLVWECLTSPACPHGLLLAALSRLDLARRAEVAARIAQLREGRA